MAETARMTATGAEGEMAVAAKAEVPTVAAVAATTIHPRGMLRAKIREKTVAEEEQVSGRVRRAILVLRIRTRL